MGNVISKMGNAQILSKNKRVVAHIPETYHLTKPSLTNMLQKYHTIYVKPDNSCQGKGVIRVDRKQTHFRLKTRDRKNTYHLSNIDQVMNCIQREKMKRVYIIQQGIDSYTSSGRLFDIRVHLIRIENKWEIGGIIGRVANKHGVATNAYSGGRPVLIDILLEEHLLLGEDQRDKCKAELTSLSLEATKTFSKAYPKWTEYGLDIGIDQNKHLWIYEINIKPGLLVFKNDSASLQRIKEMKKLRA